MAKVRIPRGLPDCELVKELARKADKRTDTAFDFLGTLESFRKQVSADVRYIEQVFPEYTPHDEEHHLTRLFHAADRLLEKKRLTLMNSAELMILALGLYGHDWGMAVSERQKECILRGKLVDDSELREFWVSRKEVDWLDDFARRHRVTWDSNQGFLKMEPDMWPEYVRETHATRSGERVRSFFDEIDRGLGRAAAQVCEAHYLSFEELRQADRYDVRAGVLDETVNLRALAVYARLVDLLDLTAQRTPYVIWKYVAPRDPRSRMEWEKHRALHSVTFPTHQEGRVVHVEGSTDDHEVYAALEDLRNKCQQELRGCSDTLDRMRDSRHTLDLYHVEWIVTTERFDPVSIRFEFDRAAMFEILRQEIHQGDPYVFLRELLQNSIDAIRMRRAVLERRGIPPGDFGVIAVQVERGDDGDAVVTWHDQGIGMDEHIVRNYLAVAGKSYYRSAEFQRQDLHLDPIARFGIGILSCFMVADRVEIDTSIDPYFLPGAEALRITIPSVQRQFRVEKMRADPAAVGTTVRVFISGSKLCRDAVHQPQSLDVTEYLCAVAGFVEFPISVTEDGRTTIILHPRADADAARKRFGPGVEVRQLNIGYDWSKSFLPRYLQTAEQNMREVRWDLATDLNLEGCEGGLSYLVPREVSADTESASGGDMDVRGVAFVSRGRPAESPTVVRWRRRLGAQTPRPAVPGSLTSSHGEGHSTYREGILLWQAPPPSRILGFGLEDLPAPRLVINFLRSGSRGVDLARSRFVPESYEWDEPIADAHARRVVQECISNLLSLAPCDRLYELGRTCVFHRLDAERLWNLFPQQHWPLPFLERGGQLNALEWQDVRRDPIQLCPELLGFESGRLLALRWLGLGKYHGPLSAWVGDPMLIRSGWMLLQTSHGVEQAAALWRFPVEEQYTLSHVRFLSPPWDGDPPLIVKVLSPKSAIQQGFTDEALLEQVVGNPADLGALQLASLHEGTIGGWLGLGAMPDAARFPAPYEHSFAYGSDVLNLRHPAAVFLLRFVAALEFHTRRRALPADVLTAASDAVRRAFDAIPVHRRRHEGWLHEAMRELVGLSSVLALPEIPNLDDILVAADDFVPGTARGTASLGRDRPGDGRPFGELIV